MQSDAFGQEFHRHGAPIALHVDDVAAAREELEAKGVKFLADTIDSGVCHMAIFSDPDGNQLMFHNRYAPKDAKPGRPRPRAAPGPARRGSSATPSGSRGRRCRRRR